MTSSDRFLGEHIAEKIKTALEGKKKQKVWELTTNQRDGFAKWMVRGIKTRSEARKVARQGFGKKYYSKTLISYYDDYPSQYGTDWKKAPTKKRFIQMARKTYKY